MKIKQVFLSLGEVALVLDVDVRTIRRWVNNEQDPLPVSVRAERPGQKNKYDAAQVVAWFIRHRQADLYAAEDQEGYDYEVERARLTHEQADKVTLENSQLRRELIPREVVESTWTEMVSFMRGRFLGMPTKLAPAIQGSDDLTEIRAILTEGVHEALLELSTNGLPEDAHSRVVLSAQNIKTAQAAAQTNR